MVATSNTYDVFISYYRWDYSFAKEQIEHFGNSFGLKCFFDNDLAASEEFTLKITEAIENSKIVVFFYDNGVESVTWNKHELLYAERLNKPIILVNLEESEPQGWYGSHFQQKYISYNKGIGIPDIVAEIKRTLNSGDYIFTQELENRYKSIQRANGVNDDIIEDNTIEAENTLEKIRLELKRKLLQGDTISLKNELPQENDAPIHIPSGKLVGPSYNVKFMASEPCMVFIDGEFFIELQKEQFFGTHLEPGEYIAKYQTKDGRSTTEVLAIGGQGSKAKIIRFEQAQQKSARKIQCFIAGSTHLKDERRSFSYVISRLHNQWRNRNFSIESFSYEDFSRSVQEEGQQNQYNHFIENEAEIVMFVFDASIGHITLDELNVAVHSYQQKHAPQIYIYSKRQENGENEEMEDLRKRMEDLNHYWVNYESIGDLEKQFEHDMNWYLFDIYAGKSTPSNL